MQKKTLIIASNPNHQSLTLHAARHAQKALMDANIVHDFIHLDACNFDPLLQQQEIVRRFSFDTEVLSFQKNVTASTRIAFFYPDWWGFPPALLVGWIQRVLSHGCAFSIHREAPGMYTSTPLLSHVSILYAINTDADGDDAVVHTHIAHKRLAHFAGMKQSHICALTATAKKSYKIRKQWIQTCTSLLTQDTWDSEHTIL